MARPEPGRISRSSSPATQQSSTAIGKATACRVQRDRYFLFLVETQLDDGSHAFEITDDRNIVPVGISVVYDPALSPPNQLKAYTPASWSDGLLAADFRCVQPMVAEAADRADALARAHGIGRYSPDAATLTQAQVANTI